MCGRLPHFGGKMQGKCWSLDAGRYCRGRGVPLPFTLSRAWIKAHAPSIRVMGACASKRRLVAKRFSISENTDFPGVTFGFAYMRTRHNL